MLKKLLKWTVLSLIFLNEQAFSDEVQWINAENAETFEIGWTTQGDFFSVNVLVNGHAPFTCAMLALTTPALKLGENGECDIRSSSLDGEITIEVIGLNDAGEVLGKAEMSLMKDTLFPEITEQNGKLFFSDNYLNPDSIHCSLDDVPLTNCEIPTSATGILRAKVADLAGNQTMAVFQLK